MAAKKGWDHGARTLPAVLPPGAWWPGGRTTRVGEWLCGLGVRLFVEGELVEVGRRAVAVEVDGASRRARR